MHSGHNGLPQTTHLCVTWWPGCLRQNSFPIGTAGDSVAAGAGADVCVEMRMAGRGAGAGAGAATGAATGTAMRMGAGGAATGGGNGIATGIAAGGADVGAADTPSSWRMSWFTAAELSAPHAGQMHCTGVTAMSGVMSKASFVPQAHWIFIRLV